MHTHKVYNTDPNEMPSLHKSHSNFNEMNAIKESIGNILYEKWFLKSFSKNNEYIDRLPKNTQNMTEQQIRMSIEPEVLVPKIPNGFSQRDTKSSRLVVH